MPEMKLTLYRFHSSPQDTVGILYIDGVFGCFVLEDEYRLDKVMNETRIPAGRYHVALQYSPKFSPRYGHEMLSVLNVPGFTDIRIHKGNTEADTSGCLLVGLSADISHGGRSRILRSTEGYNYVYPIIAEAVNSGDVEIEVVDEQKR